MRRETSMNLKLASIPLLLLPVLLSSGCAEKARSATTAKPSGVPVRTAAVERRDLEETLVLTGTLRPRQQVQVVSELNARLVRIVKDEGAPVDAGQTLAVLDDTDYRLALERAQAAQAVAEANRAHALVERERADNLKKTGGITEKDQLAAQVNLQVAEAAMAQVRAEVAIAAQLHGRAQVKAPFSGRVARRLVDAGSMLTAGTPLFTLVDDALLEFRAAVPSSDYGKLRVGAPVEVSIDALPGKSSTGKVARITPLVDERTRSFEVVVQVPGGPDLVGGLFARARVRVGQIPGALVVPPGALLRTGSNEADAFVVAKGSAERRTVTLGLETAQVVQIARGLEAGELVVLDPPAALQPGTPVDVQPERKN